MNRPDVLTAAIADGNSTSCVTEAGDPDTIRERNHSAETSATPVAGSSDLLPLLASSMAANSSMNVVVGQVVGFAEESDRVLVTFPGMSGTAAYAARAVIDLSGTHVGRSALLVFEDGNLSKPIVIGVLKDQVTTQSQLANTEVEVDGERLVVAAKEQLVLRCGKATITLTRAGKVLIEGTYVSTRATGVNRVKGGVVQIN